MTGSLPLLFQMWEARFGGPLAMYHIAVSLSRRHHVPAVAFFAALPSGRRHASWADELATRDPETKHKP